MTEEVTPATLRILLVEDDEHDVYAFRRALREAAPPCDIVRCEDAESALVALAADPSRAHLVVTDYRLPTMTGLELFTRARAQGIHVPFVILTGSGSESVAVEALKAGVEDYLIKDPDGGYLRLLPVVLPQAVRRQHDRLARRRAEEEKDRLIQELQEALAQVKVLKGLLPICSHCKKIRDDQGYWKQLEAYLKEHSEADFTHSICPECMRTMYPDVAQED